MSLVLELRRRGRHVIGPTFGALVVGYFLFHAVQGDRGILAWAELKQEVAEAEQTLSRLAGKRKTLDARVALLRSASLDRDLLDERARIAAGLTKPGEIVIFVTEPDILP
jgi:cell division protein FtsB